ncbi:MAG: YdeI/OmpD-associated family protein [Rubrivivax sp.]
MITAIEDYFAKGCGRCERFATPDCSAQRWSQELLQLRSLCLGVGLLEAVKWGHPCYLHAGRNIAILGAFRHDLRISFFDAALLKDPHRVLEHQGPNTRHPDMLRFTDVAGIKAMASVLQADLTEAKGYAEAGSRPPRAPPALVLPPELAEALAADAALAEAFHALTPGRQRSHVIHVNAAKQSTTRVTRIHALRPRILAGKGAQER